MNGRLNTTGRRQVRGIPGSPADGCFRLGNPGGKSLDKEVDTAPVAEREPHYGLDYWESRDQWMAEGRARQRRLAGFAVKKGQR